MTAQIGEILIDEGEECKTMSIIPLPTANPVVRRLTEEELRGRSGIWRSTACWRGYIGTWEIRDGRLYLVDLQGEFALESDRPVFADWVSEVIVVPRGELLGYVHMGFASVYEEELHISVSDGVITGRTVLDNRGRGLDMDERIRKNFPAGGITLKMLKFLQGR